MKKIIILLFLPFLASATIDDTQGFYKAGLPYYNLVGSSYYLNPAMDPQWGGDRWIFKTGYQIPVYCPCSSNNKNAVTCYECFKNIKEYR